MPRRSIAPRTLDDAAFPVRLKLRVPPAGFGQNLIEILRWLRREVGNGNFAHHEAETLEEEALGVHFRCLEDAAAFMTAFPDLQLADGTVSRSYARQRASRGATPPTSGVRQSPV
jgi:hypothetical protein